MELASFKGGLPRNLYFLEKRVPSELNEAWKQLKQDEKIHTSWWVHDKFIFESAKDFVDFKKNSTFNLEVLFEGLNMLSEQMLESIKGTRTP